MVAAGEYRGGGGKAAGLGADFVADVRRTGGGTDFAMGLEVHRQAGIDEPD